MTDGLLDTSVFIANESGRSLDRKALPARSYISVITMAEIEAGVFAASDTDVRAIRLKTLQALAGFESLPVDAGAAHEWARLRFRLAEQRLRANANDLWIAAIALAHDLPVVAQNGNFDVLRELGGPTIVRV